MTEKKESWYLSPDGEYYLSSEYGSKDEAICAGLEMFQEISTGKKPFNDLYPDAADEWLMDNPTFYVGEKMEWWPSVDEEYLLDTVIEQACDYAGEFAEDWPNVTKEQQEKLRSMLQDTFDKWMKETKNEPWFFMVHNSEEIDPRRYELVES